MPASSGRGLPATTYGLLVAVQADAVAGAVQEGVAVAGGGDQVAGHRVDRLARSRPGGRRRTAARCASCSTA